jgi:ribonuclease P protein component
MLNSKNRISNRNLINKLFEKGGTYKNDYFIFRFLPSDLPVSKFAVIIGGKITKKAVNRNKLRRQIHEAIRLNLKKLKTDLVVLVVAKPVTKNAEYEKLEKAVIDFFNQHKLHAK